MTPRRFLFLSGAMAVGLFLSASEMAWAQRPTHYFPIRPPISPYLFYSALNTTGLPNYYTYVLPATQFRSFTQRTAPDVARLNDRITLMGDRVDQLSDRQLGLRGTTGVGAPAEAATFMNTTHYYRPSNVPRRR